jgi:hypothetical protein
MVTGLIPSRYSGEGIGKEWEGIIFNMIGIDKNL